MPWNEVMHKWKAGTLKSGGSGEPVHSQKQAIAIMLSEKRKAAEGKKEYQIGSMLKAAGRMKHGAKG